MGKSDRRRNELKIGDFLEDACVAAVVVDLNGSVVYMNDAAELLTGWKIEEALGCKCSELFSVLDGEKSDTIELPVSGKSDNETATGTGIRGVLSRKTGSKIRVRGYASFVKAGKGNFSGTLLLLQKTSEGTGMCQTHDGVLGVSSHELRTPLSVISYALHNIRSDQAGMLSDRQSLNLDTAFRNLEYLTKLISNAPED